MVRIHKKRPWQSFYNTEQWRQLRRSQLHASPICVRCEDEGLILPADVVNHIKPHKGDWDKFIDQTNLESVCKQCHDSHIQSEEIRGYSKAIGLDGWPKDSAHPVNSGKIPKTMRKG